MDRKTLTLTSIVILSLAGLPTARARPAAVQPRTPLPDGSAGEWVDLISSSPQEVVLDVQVDGFESTEITVEGQTYQRLTLPGAGRTQEVGRPEVPAIGQFVAIPPGATVEVQVTDVEETILEGYSVYPAQAPPVDCPCEQAGQPPFALDEATYAQDAFHPQEIVSLGTPQTMRQLTVVWVAIHPLQFNPAQGELRFTRSMRVRLTFAGGVDAFASAGGIRPHESFRDLCQAFVINCNAAQSDLPQEAAQPDADDYEYLIITTPAFESAANTLAAWRNAHGLSTVVKTTDETGVYTSTIKGYIKAASYSWPLAYVLFLGDADHIPVHYQSVHPYNGLKTGTDLYYATLGTAGDVLPDLHLGRIPVRTLNEANAVVDRIVAYEQDPPQDVGFYKRATMAAYFQDDDDDGEEDRLFIWTSEQIRDHLIAEGYDVERLYNTHSSSPLRYSPWWPSTGQLLPGDLRGGAYPWDAGGADIVSALNRGSFLLNHRDHGYIGGWGDPPFNSSHINQLDDNGEAPVVFSLNCESGWFDSETDDCSFSYDPCFAETFLRPGSTPHGRAVGVFAATRVSYSWYNDEFARGLYDSIWPDLLPYSAIQPSPRMGNTLTHAKYYLAYVYGTTYPISVTTLELFHYLGDPAMEIHTQPPYVAADFPFYDGFESGQLDDVWMTYTTAQGRVQVSSSSSSYAHSGTYGLLLDSALAETYSYAPAILTIDLSEQSAVDLAFWWREFSDEDHAGDGVFVSDDYGETWHKTFSFSGDSSSWQNQVVDIDDAALSHGLELNDHFQIKFQFYDNYPAETDGYAIDDVSVRLGDVEPSWIDNVEHGVYGWTADGLWHRVGEGISPYPESRSPSCSWWYGLDSTGTYDTGSANSGTLTSPPVFVSTSVPTPTLNFWSWYEVEQQSSPFLDRRLIHVSVDGGPFGDEVQILGEPMGIWYPHSLDLSAYKGHTIQIRFTFDTVDEGLNDYRGWYIDDVWISRAPIRSAYLPTILRNAN